MLPTTSQIKKLGTRIGSGQGPLDEDTFLQLQEFRSCYVGPLATVQRILDGELGLECTTRTKTTNTIVEKLRRPNPPRLSTMQDVAGARIVVKGGLASQDSVVQLLENSFPVVLRKEDRRANPRSGYRAVHVIVEVEGYPVEIQVRTWMQDAWAQAYEKLADEEQLGRGIRYGEIPPDPPTLTE
jgi:hypothetical protein